MTDAGTTVDAALLELLRCPACREELDAVDAGLTCRGCDRTYPVRNGVPILLVDEAQQGPGGASRG